MTLRLSTNTTYAPCLLVPLRCGGHRHPDQSVGEGGDARTRRAARYLGSILLAVGFAACLSGCASIPRESVDLSYTLGQDLESVHQSYRDLITRYFEALRAQVNNAIDQV